MANCIICLEDITKTNNIHIMQQCNCFYDVHDSCMAEWYKRKAECIICHKPIKLFVTKRCGSNHRPFINNLMENTNHGIQREENNIQEETEVTPLPPRMNFFFRLFKCCKC